MLIAVESNDELDGAVSRTASTAGAGNLRFPVSGFLVEPAECLAALGNGGPRLGCARNMGNEAAGWNRYLTTLRGVTLRHAEAAGLFGRSVEVEQILGLRVRLERPETEQHEEADGGNPQ